MAKDLEKNALQSKYERIIGDPDIRQVLETFGAVDLQQEQLPLFFRILDGKEYDLESQGRKLAKELGQSLTKVKMGIRTVQNIYRGRSFVELGIAGDPQFIEGDYHHDGLSNKG